MAAQKSVREDEKSRALAEQFADKLNCSATEAMPFIVPRSRFEEEALQNAADEEEDEEEG